MFVRHESIGNGYLYGEAASKTDNVITYRLLPGDATYANNTIRDPQVIAAAEVFKSYPKIFSKLDLTYRTLTADQIAAGETTVDDDIVLSGLASERGEGYNSIFIKFGPSLSHEKMDSDVNGETNYKFNFVEAEVYEETINGIKSLGDPVVFSLIENDNITNEPILDKTTGNDLFVNNIFKDTNSFVTLNVNPKYSVAMNEKATIDEITPTRLIIEDSATVGKYYEVKVETYEAIVVDNNGVNHRVPTPRLTAIITNTVPSATNSVLKYNDGTNDVGMNIVITNSVITLAPSSAIDATTPTVFKVDGQDAFYDISIAADGSIVYTEIPLLRHLIYKNLMNYSMKLYSGTDGDNLHLNNKLNMIGTSSAGKENAKELLLNFYNNTDDLREILYPKYDFDYIPDWSEDADVCVAIVNLADDIGLSMPIISLPLAYDPTITTLDLVDKDLLTRKDKLFQSSYNSALYTGQTNKTHKTDNNLRMYMPLSYYAMIAHLRIDNAFSVTEPVANMIKGTLDSTNINLTYEPTSLEIEKLRNAQINSVIVEPDGTYIIDQLTMYKKASKLSRINIVKVLHRIRKDLPRLLKDLLQTKAIGSIIDTAVFRTEQALAKWVITPENIKDGIFESATVKATFNDTTYKLRLTITVKPVGTLESIDIPIIVV